MSERGRVLYLAPWVDLGGSDKGTIDLFRHTDHRRWEMSLICTQPSPNRWVHAIEPHAEEVWLLPDVLVGEAFPSFILGFVESREIDVVHIMNSRLGFDLLPDLAALRRPPKVVVQLHAEEPGHGGYAKYVATRYTQLIDAFSVTSVDLAERMRDYGVRGEKLSVIYTGIDAEEHFNPGQATPFLETADGPPVVLWPGRLVDQKDPHLTLDVLAGLKDRGIPFRAEIVGDGDLKPEIVERASRMDLNDVIRFHPASQEMPRWYRSSAVTLMTSAFEGLPYVIYESLAMGVPVVAPSIAANAELMDEESGFLIDPRDDVAAYVDGLERLLSNDAERRRMGDRARARMRRDFTVQRMADEHGELYERLLAESPVSQPEREVPPLEQIRLPRPTPARRTVSVIVPCFRHGGYLEQAIGSIVAQTHPVSQIVVIDDASDDTETMRALDCVARWPGVTVIRRTTNGGPSAARNQALDQVDPDSSYVLPLDADDMLFPEAVESMVEQLETAADDVGFIYPRVQHFGNRHDAWDPPEFNPYLLMLNNYCASASLFDARIFGGGVRYAEDLRVGHEDWDLVLTLIGRGVGGRRSRIPTLLYRQQGFSRIDLDHLSQRSTKSMVRRRHPELFERRGRLKALHAPALSVVLLPGDDWEDEILGAAPRSTMRDVEFLVAGGETEPGDVVARPIERCPPAQWLARAITAARGLMVMVCEPAARGLLLRRDGFEQIVRGLDQDRTDGAVYVAAGDGTAPLHALRAASDPTSEPAVLVAWRRSRFPGARREISLSGGDPLSALALAVEENGPMTVRVGVRS
jgi:glycosyltransferase involved in cell wall biosynthesis